MAKYIISRLALGLSAVRSLLQPLISFVAYLLKDATALIAIMILLFAAGFTQAAAVISVVLLLSHGFDLLFAAVGPLARVLTERRMAARQRPV